MKLHVRVGRAELIEQLIDVLRLDDVIDSVEVEYAVASRELVELLDNVLNLLGTELHAGTIQAAECAMILHAPPAAACSLNRQQNSLRPIVIVIPALFARVEILV